MRLNRLSILALALAILPMPHRTRADTFTVINTNDIGPGSLRQAIIDANSNPGPDTITFNIPTSDPGYDAGMGVWTIRPTRGLPFLTDDGTTIDGTTQAAFIGGDPNLQGPEIEIDGTNAGSGVNGFAISSADNAVEGLVINRFQFMGVEIYGPHATGNVVSGNYIGTDPSGTVDLGNRRDGIRLEHGAQRNIIGGAQASERNIISGNDRSGVSVCLTDTMHNVVIGNYIGTDRGGVAPLGNNANGVYLWRAAQSNMIGGMAPGQANVISENHDGGVRIEGAGTDDNVVTGNYIGSDATGRAALGNDGSGVNIYHGAQRNTIGPGNLIAHNGLYGVQMYSSDTTGNMVSQNSIFANVVGISLSAGANGNIAPPSIGAAIFGSLHVTGTACPGCTVEIFENGDDDGEGETYVGDSVATASGAFTVTVTWLTKPYLTATATHPVSGTSRFSLPFVASLGRLCLPIVLSDY